MQPSDWHEHDVRGVYVVDVFGRLRDKSVACVRVKGFKPYFYVSGSDPGKAERVQRYDAMAGFDSLKTIGVWKVSCASLNEYHSKVREMNAQKRTLYESNLPPFLRLLHERHLGPGSPIQFVGEEIDVPMDPETGEPLFTVNVFYECEWTTLKPTTGDIPLKVACYDLEMCPTTGNNFPMASKDPIVQIGISYRWSNDLMAPTSKKVFVLGSVDPSDDPLTEFVPCKSEIDMLFKFAANMRRENPDIMSGYNTFGFDDQYIEDRCRTLGILEDINLSRAPPAKTKKGDQWDIKFAETKKFELASGKYDLRILCMRGRLSVDLLLNMRREHSLDSFKLDNVASVFLRDKVLEYTNNVVTTKSTRGLCVGNYTRFDLVGNTTDPYRDGEKFKVIAVNGNTFTIEATTDLFADLTAAQRKSLEWTFSKDDVEPHELFRLHREGGSEGRARIAKYCIQDCDLVLTLMAKLDTIVNARGMADVCKVPMQFVLMRGQGIKIFSAVVYYASQRNQIIEVQHAIGDDEAGYEGAVVISPKIGMYLDQPISVLDFNSLYPTNMIAYNISPDTLVSLQELDENDKVIQRMGKSFPEMQQLKAAGYVLDEVEYDTKDEKGMVVGKTVCTYVQPKPDQPMLTGVLPKTLEILLAKRKEYKQMMEDPKYDEAQRSVYNGLQLAYKVVANSVYGQTGSRTSPIRKLCVAACTTAAGRKALYLAKQIVESEFGADVIYGDTDSIFIKFPTKDLAKSIELGIKAGKRITEQCRRPYKIAYEKTLFPFILFCRKRYVGMKYEEDPNPKKAKRMMMGIALKRRDSAPISKDVYGGALDILMGGGTVAQAREFVNKMLKDMIDNKIPLDKYIMTKALSDNYKVEMPHRMLADRMEARDPGTAPKVGDRVRYVFVKERSGNAKQGDRIEHVDYVRSHGLVPDVTFYITNQVQSPLLQLFALCVEQLSGYHEPSPSYANMYLRCRDQISVKQPELTEVELDEEATRAVLKLKEKQVDALMFLKSVAFTRQPTIHGFFKKTDTVK
uniref:DNA-directed DNA polymerase n=1 Tax=viral metagenome TaxID=1070528 RepID=A0A6C0AJA0_9ZZZZ